MSIADAIKNATLGDLFRDITPEEAAYSKGWAEGYKEGLTALPTDSDAIRRKGRWKDFSDDGYVECPFCGHATNCDGNIDDLHFCFWCGAEMDGADMRGEDNGNQ